MLTESLGLSKSLVLQLSSTSAARRLFGSDEIEEVRNIIPKVVG